MIRPSALVYCSYLYYIGISRLLARLGEPLDCAITCTVYYVRTIPGRDGFDVRSDVWSLGISVIELATGRFPFPPWNSVFDQLTSVVEGNPPCLPEAGDFSDNFRDFVVKCLIKDVDARPKYRELLTHPFIVESESRQVDVEGWVSNVLSQAAAKKFKL